MCCRSCSVCADLFVTAVNPDQIANCWFAVGMFACQLSSLFCIPAVYIHVNADMLQESLDAGWFFFFFWGEWGVSLLILIRIWTASKAFWCICPNHNLTDSLLLCCCSHWNKWRPCRIFLLISICTEVYRNEYKIIKFCRDNIIKLEFLHSCATTYTFGCSQYCLLLFSHVI